MAVFSSNHLPVTIVQTEEAEDVYKQLLGSELLAVPCGGPQRLSDWPGLQAKEDPIEVKGLGWQECCADIILSSAGKFTPECNLIESNFIRICTYSF